MIVLLPISHFTHAVKFLFQITNQCLQIIRFLETKKNHHLHFKLNLGKEKITSRFQKDDEYTKKK